METNNSNIVIHERSKQYLAELALKVKTIQDDILGETVDVESQLVRVTTSGADWKSFQFSDLDECRKIDHGLDWVEVRVDELKAGDIFHRRIMGVVDPGDIIKRKKKDEDYKVDDIVKVISISKNEEDYYDIELELPDGETTKISKVWYGTLVLKSRSGFDDFKSCSQKAKEGRFIWELFKIRSWRGTKIKVGDILRKGKERVSFGKVISTASPESSTSTVFTLLLPDGTRRSFQEEWDCTWTRLKSVEAGCCSEGWKSVCDSNDAAKALLENTEPVLMIAGPGTGKTFFMQQLCNRIVSILSQTTILNNDVLLPVLIPVQRLARILRQEKTANSDEVECGLELLHTFFEMEHRLHFDLLKERLAAGRLILLIDGVDEAAGMKETIETLVLDILKPMGQRMVITSRPEGIRLPLYFHDFNIMHLLPLSSEQQLAVIQRFVKKDEFLASLIKLVDVRKGHDEIYNEVFKDKRKNYMETLEVLDLLKLETGKWDPGMRQKAVDGSDLRPRDEIQSSYLQPIHKRLMESDFLVELEKGLRDRIESKDKQELRRTDAEELVDIFMEKSGMVDNSDLSDCRNLLVRLSLLWTNMDHGFNTMTELWNSIASRTDELYISAEHSQPIFKKLIATLKDQFSAKNELLLISFGPIKDPIRVFEKAQNDYAERFADGLPESCVIDLLRVRLTCEDASTMEGVLKTLQKEEGMPHLLEDNNTVVRMKNMFHTDQMGPTHFRFIILSLQLFVGDSRFLVEVQLHHKGILEHEVRADGHTAYEYFRSALQDRYHIFLDDALQAPRIEESLSRFESMAQVPVLLSLIVVILREGGRDDPLAALQLSKFDLYDKAMACLINRTVGEENYEEAEQVVEMLLQISTYNMRAQKRIFDDDDVRRALVGDNNNADLFQKWLDLRERPSGCPLVKIVSQPSILEGGEYQFKHLSFCEALYFKSLTRSGEKLSPEESWKLVSNPFNINVIQFGPEELARVLNFEENIASFHSDLSEQGVEIMQTVAGTNLSDCQTILGVLVGDGPPAVAATDSVPTVEYGTTNFIPKDKEHWYKKIISGDGILLAMVNGETDKVKSLVEKDGNLPVKELDAGSGPYHQATKLVVAGFQLHSYSFGMGQHSGDWKWDGISAPLEARNLLELAIESLQLEVARAIQDGMVERGQKCDMNAKRFFRLLKSGVRQHLSVRAFLSGNNHE